MTMCRIHTDERRVRAAPWKRSWRQAERRSCPGLLRRLWRTSFQIDGEHYAAVEVVIATAEPDGSYRRYFLRVPPATRTAREAFAWTFGFQRVADYIVAAAS